MESILNDETKLKQMSSQARITADSHSLKYYAEKIKKFVFSWGGKTCFNKDSKEVKKLQWQLGEVDMILV